MPEFIRDYIAAKYEPSGWSIALCVVLLLQGVIMLAGKRPFLAIGSHTLPRSSAGLRVFGFISYLVGAAWTLKLLETVIR